MVQNAATLWLKSQPPPADSCLWPFLFRATSAAGSQAGTVTSSKRRFGASLVDHIELLKRFPRLGSVIRKRSRVRKLLHSPLLVYYRLDEAKRGIDILHIRHGARSRPQAFRRREPPCLARIRYSAKDPTILPGSGPAWRNLPE
jgi:plasmid stabilization system protein ParE